MSSVMSRLLWKDYRSIRGLLVALPIIIVILSLTAEIVGLLTGVRRSELNGMYVTIWVLLPGLYALGLPAILIGGEHESGALDWLKMLPARWWQILFSKFVVCLIGVVLAWVPTGGLLYFSASAAGDLPGTPAGIGVWVLIGIVIFLFVNLTTGFFFRSPVTAILVAFPMTFASYIGLGLLGEWWVRFRPVDLDPQAARTFAAVTLTAFAFVSWFGLMVWAARRRLTVRRDFTGKLSTTSPLSGFRPPVTREISDDWRVPGQYRALLWSHLWPIRWQLLGVIALALVSLAFAGNSAQPWTFVFMPVVVFTLGSLTFFGDSSRNQVAFFFDRGLHGSGIWVTRVVPLTLLAGILIALHLSFFPMDFLDNRNVTRPWYGGGSMMLACIWFSSFAVGHLVSQWASRTTLSFFAGPVLFYLLSAASMTWYYYYPNAIMLTLLSSIVLFLASYRLMDAWISRQTNSSRYLIPWFSWIAIGLFLPLPLILSTRWATMPAQRTEWRQEMAGSFLPEILPQAPSKVKILATLKMESAIRLGGPEDVDSRMQSELEETDELGKHVSIMDVVDAIHPAHSYLVSRSKGWERISGSLTFDEMVIDESRLLALRVLEKWSNEIRKQLIEGEADFTVLRDVAEPIDHLRADLLRCDAGSFAAEIEQLKAALPTREELDESRRVALVRSWQSYQADPESSQPRRALRKFLGEYVKRIEPWWLSVERARTDRYVDETAYAILESWQNRTLVDSDRLDRTLREIGFLPAQAGKDLTEALKLMHVNDQLIDSLRGPKRISATVFELSLVGI